MSMFDAPVVPGMLLGILLAFGAERDAVGQVPERGVEAPRDLRRPVDQGLADRNHLGTSLRSLPQALDPARGFGRLYVDPRRPERFLRRQGGLAAVFPRSVYRGEGADGVPVVPPGTIFEIGWEQDPPSGGGDSHRLPTGSGAVPKELVSPDRDRLDPSAFLVAAPRWNRDGAPDRIGIASPPSKAGFGDPLEAFDAPSASSSRRAESSRPRLLRDRSYRMRRLDELLGRAVAGAMQAD